MFSSFFLLVILIGGISLMPLRTSLGRGRSNYILCIQAGTSQEEWVRHQKNDASDEDSPEEEGVPYKGC